MRKISAGRPMANGQAEIYVKSVKQKIKCLIHEIAQSKNEKQIDYSPFFL